MGKGTRAPAALGLRAHSGWAALVAVGGTIAAPRVIARRRIEMAGDAGAKQPYHAAEGQSVAEAAALIDRFVRQALEGATRGLAAALEGMARQGYDVVGAIVLTAAGRPLPDLGAVLASHALIHAADGEHFRAALAAASAHHGLPVARVREKELLAQAEAALRRPGSELQAAVAAWGKSLGPPWTQDQKLSALAAWMGLVLARAPYS
jgi:hypothetical protein